MTENPEYRFLYVQIQHLKELMEEKDKAMAELMVEKEKALALQAKEYERRLEILNGEAERLRTMQITYLPREVYYSEKKETEGKIQLINDWKSENKGSQAVLLRWWSVGLIVISAFVSYIIKKVL